MAVKREVSPEDEALAVPLIIMAASAYMIDDNDDEYQQIIDKLWPKTVHVHAVELGARAVMAFAQAVGIEAEIVTTIGAALLAAD